MMALLGRLARRPQPALQRLARWLLTALKQLSLLLPLNLLGVPVGDARAYCSNSRCQSLSLLLLLLSRPEP